MFTLLVYLIALNGAFLYTEKFNTRAECLSAKHYYMTYNQWSGQCKFKNIKTTTELDHTSA